MTADEDLPVVDAVNDRYARGILAAASRAPLSANQLDERLDADLSTIYRRLEQLEELGLVTSRVELSRDGHHYRRYQTRVRRVTIDFVDGEVGVRVDRVATDPADRLADLFEELR